MARHSLEFGRIIKGFLQKNKMTFRTAAFQTELSAAYWKDMSDGRVPSEDVIERISDAFEDLNENELRMAAGYMPAPGKSDAVTTVEMSLRGQQSIPEEGVKQILDFVKKIQDKYSDNK